MSLMTQVIVAETYGLRLNTEQIAKVLGITKASLYNQISAGACPIKTYLDGGKRWADYRDVAEHLDACRAHASASA